MCRPFGIQLSGSYKLTNIDTIATKLAIAIP